MAGLQQQGDTAPAAMASTDGAAVAETSNNRLEEPDHSSSNWYFPREYIEKNSPSRKDGIDLKRETYFRKSYCTFLQDLGMRLKVPQVTIATAIVFCHRFFLRQSHLRNDRYLIATTCMFLAGKVEETPQKLCDVIYLSYEIRNKKDPTAVQRIKQKDVYEPQKELVLLGERLVLATLGFDLNIHHPYKPLVAAIKKFKVAQNALAQVAWNFVNDGLRTSLCLQFKPHHIAAGAIFLAAKFLKVKLPSEGEKVWWQEFDVTPRQLEEVSNQMLELYEQNKEVPTSRTSDPSASIGSIRKKATCDVPSSSAAAEKFGDVKSKENLSSHKKSTGDGFPPASTISEKMKDEHSIGDIKPRLMSSTNVDAEVGLISVQSGLVGADGTIPKVTDENATSGGDVPYLSMEVTRKNMVGESKPQASSSSALEAEMSSGRIGESRSTEDTAHVSGSSLPVAVEEVGSHQESSKPGHQKADWADLADVNIDRVKAALKRRKQEARAAISKRELTDEEELLELDLENGHRDEQHDSQDFDYSHNLDDLQKEGQSNAGHSSEKYMENGGDRRLQHEYNQQNQLHHSKKFDGDVDHCQHIDMERKEGHKKPRIEY